MITYTIWDEIRAAGLSANGLIGGIGEDGHVTWIRQPSAAQRATVEAAIAAHDPLVGLRARMIAILQGAAEDARLRWVTPGSAKALEYDAKRREAEAIIAEIAAGNTLAAAAYPFANRRATRLGTTLDAVAQEWSTKAGVWTTAGAEIADLTEAAANAIGALTDSATFEADAKAVIDAIAWPTPP